MRKVHESIWYEPSKNHFPLLCVPDKEILYVIYVHKTILTNIIWSHEGHKNKYGFMLYFAFEKQKFRFLNKPINSLEQASIYCFVDSPTVVFLHIGLARNLLFSKACTYYIYFSILALFCSRIYW